MRDLAILANCLTLRLSSIFHRQLRASVREDTQGDEQASTWRLMEVGFAGYTSR